MVDLIRDMTTNKNGEREQTQSQSLRSKNFDGVLDNRTLK